MTEKKRLHPKVFSLQTAWLRDGFFTDKYFYRARQILNKDAHNPDVLMQVFCRTHAVLCGIDEAIAILKTGCDFDELSVNALYDGDHVTPWETVMTIQGPYEVFAHLETLYLGVLARGTRIATHTRDIVNAANRKKILFFGARHDHYLTQVPDGYAAFIGGADAVATDAHGTLFDQPGSGTIPHALIAAYGGDSVLAAQKFVEHQDGSVDLVALVDFENDCVNTSLNIAQALGSKLKGVRLDTSGALVDKSLQGSTEERPGVNPELVNRVRTALDAEGYQDVQIYISGGITVQRINEFEAAQAPVDAYGVGSSILANQGRFDFTADIVQVNGQHLSKEGRMLNPNDRLTPVA
ncbi:MAG: nicotinate phosphoribosyltransferase [Pseudomonadota bacterium]